MNYDDIHDYVHEGEGDESEFPDKGLGFDQREFTRRMNVFVVDKGRPPVCEECSGAGAVVIPCLSCNGEGIQP